MPAQKQFSRNIEKKGGNIAKENSVGRGTVERKAGATIPEVCKGKAGDALHGREKGRDTSVIIERRRVSHLKVFA